MSEYLKPQSPLYHKKEDTYFYPLTTADQVITGNGERLNSLFKKTIKENATLQVANWSDTKPYTQTITLNYSVDDYNVDANVAYSDGDNAALHAAAGCISYIKKNHKEITFYCLKSKPEVDIPIEITGTCRNTIATVEEGIRLNFDIVAYATEEELLADIPMENTIGVITDVPITGYKFSATEPEDMVEGEVWIKTGDDSDVAFDIVEGTKIYPLYVKQYINGVWVDKTAMSYLKGEWVDWITYLFSADGYKGTWTPTAYYSSTTSAKKAPTISVDDGSLVISIASGYRGTAFNDTLLNFNGKKKVTITIKYTGGSGSTALLGVVNKVADNFTRLATVGFDIGSYFVTTEIDVSSLGDTNGYIAFLINAVSSTATATITEIKLT